MGPGEGLIQASHILWYEQIVLSPATKSEKRKERKKKWSQIRITAGIIMLVNPLNPFTPMIHGYVTGSNLGPT